MTSPILKSSKIKHTSITSCLSDAVTYLEKMYYENGPNSFSFSFIWFPAGLLQSKADSKTSAAQHKSVNRGTALQRLCVQSQPDVKPQALTSPRSLCNLILLYVDIIANAINRSAPVWSFSVRLFKVLIIK